MLHTVNKSPFERNNLESCLAHAAPGSTVLLIEDGIYGAVKGTAFSAKVQDAMKNLKICALAPDLEARGMGGRVIDGIKLVDYSGFVDLVAEHKTVQAWL